VVGFLCFLPSPKYPNISAFSDVFYEQGDWIELIPVALSQAFGDTFWGLTLLEGPQKMYEKNWFPNVLLYIGQHIRYFQI
jgi:hypothetical protein